MWTRRSLAGLIATGVAVAAHASPTTAGRSKEAQSLRAFAETTHPRGREAAADAGWRDSWAALIAGADSLSDGAYVLGLRRLLAWFNDGHTTVAPFEHDPSPPPGLAAGAYSRAFPISVRAFHDGLWITGAAPEAANLLGARLLEVNGRSDRQLMQAFAGAWTGNAAWAHHWAGLLFMTAGALEGLGVMGPLSVRAQTTDGRVISTTLAARPRSAVARTDLTRQPRAYEAWSKTAGSGNYAHPLTDDGVLYLSIDEMGDFGGKDFITFSREAVVAMEASGPSRLIVDLRRNGGGDNYLGEGLRKHIERSRFNRPGGLYVLAGPATFSAAQNIANRLERETFALFIGEPTGGAPNHYGDAKVFNGETTGLTAYVSTLPWFDSYPQDTRPWIFPDLPVPETFADWTAGRDPALAAARAHNDDRPDNDITRARTAVFSRDSQKAEWRPFWRAE